MNISLGNQTWNPLLLCISHGNDGIRLECLFDCWKYVGRSVLLTLWQKLQTVTRPTLTSEGRKRYTLNLVEWWTMRKTEVVQRGNLIHLHFSDSPSMNSWSKIWDDGAFSLLFQPLIYLPCFYCFLFNTSSTIIWAPKLILTVQRSKVIFGLLSFFLCFLFFNSKWRSMA